MDKIDRILEKYEENLIKAEDGRCIKVTQCAEFRNHFKNEYIEVYKPKLHEIKKKLLDKNHIADIEERVPEKIYYGFSLFVGPRHLYRWLDRYYPHNVLSSISFIANEHTLSVDMVTVINPNIEGQDNTVIEKISKDKFDENLLVEKISEFLKNVFDETIVLDFKNINITGNN